jgi:hypothetical protein
MTGRQEYDRTTGRQDDRQDDRQRILDEYMIEDLFIHGPPCWGWAGRRPGPRPADSWCAGSTSYRYRTDTQQPVMENVCSTCTVLYNFTLFRQETDGGFIKGILRGVRCTKSLRVLFLHRRPPSWTTLVLYSGAVFIFKLK